MADTTALTAAEARTALAKKEGQLSSLRERLRSIAEESASATTLIGNGLSIGAGATAAGALDALVLGDQLGKADPLMRPSTLAAGLTLGAAVAFGSPSLALAAGGMAAPAAYLQGASIGLSLREGLAKAKQARDEAAAAQKAAA